MEEIKLEMGTEKLDARKSWKQEITGGWMGLGVGLRGADACEELGGFYVGFMNGLSGITANWTI
jgi:hypothetical protein